MAELPQAIVDNPPLHRRPWVRKLASRPRSSPACWSQRRSDSNKQLEKSQDEARKRVGHLDRMFEDQLDDDDNALLLEAKFDVTRAPDVTDVACENRSSSVPSNASA